MINNLAFRALAVSAVMIGSSAMAKEQSPVDFYEGLVTAQMVAAACPEMGLIPAEVDAVFDAAIKVKNINLDVNEINGVINKVNRDRRALSRDQYCAAASSVLDNPEFKGNYEKVVASVSVRAIKPKYDKPITIEVSP